jgi:hypothetical protein
MQVTPAEKTGKPIRSKIEVQAREKQSKEVECRRRVIKILAALSSDETPRMWTAQPRSSRAPADDEDAQERVG